jgi:hypothetical protein
MMKKPILTLLFIFSFAALMGASKCSSPDLDRAGVPPVDHRLEEQRRVSALEFPEPRIKRIYRKSEVIWQEGDVNAPSIVAGEILELEGVGLGNGTNVDFSKVLVGRARVIESDLKMYVGHIDVKKAHYFEENESYV